jgi:hypothetical protein
MTLPPGPSERRQFGRRWTLVHGWICIEGRPRIACHVRNFCESGALLVVDQGARSLPYTFMLQIDAIDFKIGCEARHRNDTHVGVRFISSDLVGEIGPIWTIDELMARAATPPERLAG